MKTVTGGRQVLVLYGFYVVVLCYCCFVLRHVEGLLEDLKS